MTLRTIESAALKLTAEERSKLAALLLSSLDDVDPADAERAWIKEADRRYRDLRAGRAGSIPARQAISSARAALRK